MARTSQRSQNESMARSLAGLPIGARVSAEDAYTLAIRYVAFDNASTECYALNAYSVNLETASNKDLFVFESKLNSVIVWAQSLDKIQIKTGIVVKARLWLNEKLARNRLVLVQAEIKRRESIAP